MRVQVDVEVSKLLAAIGLTELPTAAEELGYRFYQDVEIEVCVDEEECARAAGYISEDEALETANEGLGPCARDLKDGLHSLMTGDRAMALILLDRAFDSWPEAQRVVNDMLLGRAPTDPRQLSLLAA